jgi:hypothetical protein
MAGQGGRTFSYSCEVGVDLQRLLDSAEQASSACPARQGRVRLREIQDRPARLEL